MYIYKVMMVDPDTHTKTAETTQGQRHVLHIPKHSRTHRVTMGRRNRFRGSIDPEEDLIR